MYEDENTCEPLRFEVHFILSPFRNAEMLCYSLNKIALPGFDPNLLIRNKCVKCWYLPYRVVSIGKSTKHFINMLKKV